MTVQHHQTGIKTFSICSLKNKMRQVRLQCLRGKNSAFLESGANDLSHVAVWKRDKQRLSWQTKGPCELSCAGHLRPPSPWPTFRVLCMYRSECRLILVYLRLQTHVPPCPEVESQNRGRTVGVIGRSAGCCAHSLAEPWGAFPAGSLRWSRLLHFCKGCFLVLKCDKILPTLERLFLSSLPYQVHLSERYFLLFIIWGSWELRKITKHCWS